MRALPVSVVVALASALAPFAARAQDASCAIGNNLDGAAVNGVLLSVFVLCGLAAGIAGLLTAGRTNAGAPTAGQLLELDAITVLMVTRTLPGKQFEVGRALRVHIIRALAREGINVPAREVRSAGGPPAMHADQGNRDGGD